MSEKGNEMPEPLDSPRVVPDDSLRETPGDMHRRWDALVGRKTEQKNQAPVQRLGQRGYERAKPQIEGALKRAEEREHERFREQMRKDLAESKARLRK